MNFNHIIVNFSVFANECKRCFCLALLTLLVACGGGGSGSTTSSGAPTLALTNVSETIGPAYPGNPVFLKPSFTSGTATITWEDAAKVKQTIFVEKTDTVVQVNPLATTEYTLSVKYQDPQQVKPSELIATSKLTVTITPVAVAPVALETQEMKTARSDHASVLLPDGRVLVIGGTDGTTSLKSSEVFDPSTEKWSATGDMKTARRGHTATLLLNNKVLVTGGYDGKAALLTAEVYDPSTGVWTATNGSMLTSRRFHTATLLPDGNVLIAGGVVGPASISDEKATELYLPNTGLFEHYSNIDAVKTGTVLALPEGRQGHTASLIDASFDAAASNVCVDRKYAKVLFVGNSNGVNTADAKFLFYDYNTSAHTNSVWVSTGAMVQSRRNHSAVVIAGNKVLVTGGAGPAPKSAEIYTPGTDACDTTALTWVPAAGSWNAAASMSTARALHTSTKLIDGRVLVVGGYDGTTTLNTFEIYDPTTNTWTSPSSGRTILSTSRALHTSNLLQSGDVLMVGTYYQTSGPITKNTEIWRH